MKMVRERGEIYESLARCSSAFQTEAERQAYIYIFQHRERAEESIAIHMKSFKEKRLSELYTRKCTNEWCVEQGNIRMRRRLLFLVQVRFVDS